MNIYTFTKAIDGSSLKLICLNIKKTCFFFIFKSCTNNVCVYVREISIHELKTLRTQKPGPNLQMQCGLFRLWFIE